MMSLGVASAVVLIVIAAVSPQARSVSLTLLIAAAAFLATGGIRVTVSPQEVAVASALFPFLRRRIALRRVRRASARRTSALEIGGWGYRLKPGLTAVSVRGGDALWLDLTNGKKFVITIDDAKAAARLIEGFTSPSAPPR
ncbi:hypothetical protein [Streptomyces fractus]|uniref:hypothetical protein n=1 Tax=Streptomyces fractus TaxID=641806 RepID=UPI003CF4CF26